MIRRVALFLAVCFSLGACSPFKSANKGSALDPALFSHGDSSLIPSTDKLSKDCRSQSEFDTCLYMKNPVAQRQGSLTTDQLTSELRFGVKLRGLATTGHLENEHVQVLTLHSARFSLYNHTQYKTDYSAEQSFVEQLMAYYWVNRTFEYLEPRLGSARLPISGLKVFVDDTVTGYSSQNNSISLAKASSGIPKAMSGEVLVQLLGQAIAQRLSSHGIFDHSQAAQHNSCGLNPKGCCSTELGCAGALAGSFGDYLTGVMFPSSAKIGEVISMDVGGQKICAQARDLATLNAQSKTQIFNACADKGNIALEGAWYASVWWKMRGLAEQLEAGGSRDIDILFFDHAVNWDASSTFAQAKQSALTLAANYKSGKYLGLFQTSLAGVP